MKLIHNNYSIIDECKKFQKRDFRGIADELMDSMCETRSASIAITRKSSRSHRQIFKKRNLNADVKKIFVNILKVPVHEDQKFRYVQTPRAEKEDPMRACALTTVDMV